MDLITKKFEEIKQNVGNYNYDNLYKLHLEKLLNNYEKCINLIRKYDDLYFDEDLKSKKLELLNKELDEYMVETKKIKTDCLNKEMEDFILEEKFRSSYIYQCLNCSHYIPKATMTDPLHSC